MRTECQALQLPAWSRERTRISHVCRRAAMKDVVVSVVVVAVPQLRPTIRRWTW
jgi:hypothetical protein